MLNGPTVLKENQLFVLTGGTRDGQTVNLLQYAGVGDCPELFNFSLIMVATFGRLTQQANYLASSQEL